MSLVDLRPAADLFGLLGVLDHDDGPFGDGMALSEVERHEVRDILLNVAQRLTDRALSIDSMRRRLGAIVESLIAVADALDGDCEDEGAQCEDEGAQCEDEGAQCDDEGARLQVTPTMRATLETILTSPAARAEMARYRQP